MVISGQGDEIYDENETIQGTRSNGHEEIKAATAAQTATTSSASTNVAPGLTATAAIKSTAASYSKHRYESRKEEKFRRRRQLRQQQKEEYKDEEDDDDDDGDGDDEEAPLEPPPLHGAYSIGAKQDEEVLDSTEYGLLSSDQIKVDQKAQAFYAVEAKAVEEDSERRRRPQIWAAQTVNVDKEKEIERRKRRRMYCIFSWIVVLVLVVVGVAVAVAVSMTPRQSSSNSNNGGETAAPSQSPTFASEAAFTKFLVGKSPGDGSSFQDPNSPQSKALEWILNPQFNPRLTASTDLIQRYALAVFYYSTNGDGWQINDDWLSDENVCDWFSSGSARDYCNQDKIVLELALNRNNLKGSLPSELSMLSDLSVIDLNFNELTGTLPSELGLLTNLEVIMLEENLLNGTVPSEFGRLSTLNELFVDANDLTGTMPKEVCALSNTTLKLLWGDCQEIECPCCDRCCTDGIPCNIF